MYEHEQYEIRNNAWRYPIGFRHYESYNHYQIKYPDATIEEYQMEMQREATFAEYMAMFKENIRYTMTYDVDFIDRVNELTDNNPALIESYLNSPTLEHDLMI